MMIPIEQGELDHPWAEGRVMTEAPMLDPTAFVRRSRFGAWTVVGRDCHFDAVEFHDWSYAGTDCNIYNADIGKFCNIANSVRINPTNHPDWRASLHHFTYRSRSHHLGVDDDEEVFGWRLKHRVAIGPDVWIGHGAIVLPGRQIGTGAAIGAGSIVTKDVAPYTIVAGNPARVIRRRVDEATEQKLMTIAWWNWTPAQLAAALGDFRKLQAAEFAEKYQGGAP